MFEGCVIGPVLRAKNNEAAKLFLTQHCKTCPKEIPDNDLHLDSEKIKGEEIVAGVETNQDLELETGQGNLLTPPLLILTLGQDKSFLDSATRTNFCFFLGGGIHD